MFRHERPQKGRYRQFHQFGIEALGWSGPEIETEVIAVGERLWRTLGLEGLTLEINTLGSESGRQAFRDALKGYLEKFKDDLDPDSQRRLEKNPLRILDSKVASTRAILEEAPTLYSFLGQEEQEHFERLQDLLQAAGIRYSVNPHLVRGLDYYTGFVFEWVTDMLGAQSAVCAGGRYDGLVEQLGGRAVPAAGFACGLERLIELVSLGAQDAHSAAPDIFLISMEKALDRHGVKIAETLRDNRLDVVFSFAAGSLKKQLKRADASGAAVAVIVDGEFVQSDVITVKPLRGQGEQASISFGELSPFVKKILNIEA